MHEGSCCCGAVRFTVSGALHPPDACHCSMCRKQSGHFWASTDVPRAALTIRGAEAITWFASSEKVRRAVELLRLQAPHLTVDGEMQADTAVTPEILETTYPFSTLRGGANVLVFPNLESGNIAYKLLMRIGGAEAIGPILMGISKPVHILTPVSTVRRVVNMTALAVADVNAVR